jgi:hypothetical protein
MRIIFVLLTVFVLQQTYAQTPTCDPVGSVSAVSSTIAAAERIPGSAKSVTVSFTIASALTSGQKVTITFPPNYLASGTILATAINFKTVTTGWLPQVIVEVDTAGVAAGSSHTIVLSGGILGGATLGSATGVSVVTPFDASACGSTVPLGGSVSFVSSTIMASERIPGSSKSVTVSFTIASALTSGQKVTISFPPNYFASGTITATSPNFKMATIGISPQVIVEVDTSGVAAGSSHTIVLSGGTLGAPTAASTSGVSVVTPLDLAATGSTVPLGGSVSFVSSTIAAAERIPGSSKSVTVSFTIASALTSGQKVTISFPPNYFASGTITATSPNFKMATIGILPQVIVEVDTSGVAAGSSHTIVLSGGTLGAPTAASTSGVSVVTPLDLAATGSTVPLGGSVSFVSSTIAAAERVPGLSGKSVTVAFTTATRLLPGQSVTITLPTGYISGTIGVVGTNFATATFGTAPVYVVTATADVAAGAITLTLTGATIGGPMAGSANGVSVVTTTDIAASGPTVSLGGVVTNVAFAIAAADRIPGLTGKSVTVTFTMASTLRTGQSATITLPTNYISGTIGVVGTNFATATFGTAHQYIVTATADVAAGAITLTLTGATIGGPRPQACNGVWVSTTSDLRSTNVVSPPALGGTVSAVSSTIAIGERVPGKAKPVTVSFTVATAMPASHKVTITFPSNYIAFGTITATAPNFKTTTMGTLPQVIVEVDTAGVAAGSSHTIVLSGGVLGAPTAASTSGVSVATSSDMAAFGAAVALGGVVSNVGISITPAERIPALTGKSVTVSFTTATLLASGQSVTITLPTGYISGTIGAVGTNFATTTTGTAPVYIVTATADVAAGAITLTLTGATIGGPVAASSGSTACGAASVAVSTTVDLAGRAHSLQLGGEISNVASSIAAADRIPGLTGKSVTVTFTTASTLRTGQSATITLPTNYISGTIGVVGTNFATATFGTAHQYIVTATADVAAGAITLTLTGATIGGPMPGSANGVRVSSTTDRVGAGASVALGGIVTGAALTIAAADRIPGVSNRRIVVSFTTASVVPTGGSITIALPLGFVTALTAGITTIFGLTAVQALVGSSVVLTATADVVAGAKVVTVCGATLGFQPQDNSFGVSVTTSRDYTLTCSSTGTVGVAFGSITAVSMMIPFANRIEGTTVSAVFGFTTSRAIPAPTCGASNTLTIGVPHNFFTSGTPVATGLAGYTAAANFWAGIITLSGTAEIAAGRITVTISGLTLGARTAGSDSGVTVAAPLHAASVGVTSGPISNYEVTSVAVTGTCQTSSACRTVTIGINAAGQATTILPGSTLVISGLPFIGTPDAMSFGIGIGTIVTSSAVTGNSVFLTVHPSGAPWTLGESATITLSGLTLSQTSSYFSPWTVSVGGSTPMWSRTYAATSVGTTTTTSLSIDRPQPGAINVKLTISFTTTAPILSGDTVRVYYPPGFFAPPAPVLSCPWAAYPSSVVAFGLLGMCNVPLRLFQNAGVSTSPAPYFDVQYAGPRQDAGAHTMIASGLNLGSTPWAASDAFSVATSQNLCSAGTVSIGIIQTDSECPKGYFSSGDAVTCTPCPPATYSMRSTATNSTVCVACPEKTFSLGAASECLPMPPVKYCWQRCGW